MSSAVKGIAVQLDTPFYVSSILVMKISALFLFVAASVRLCGEDPKAGATREEVVKMLGEPSGRMELRNGGAIYSYPRGDVTFDKNKATKVDLVTALQAEEAKDKDKSQREALALRNAPGGEGYLEKKRQELGALMSSFVSAKTPGDALTYFVHKSSACYRFTQYAPDGPGGLTISVQVSSDGGLALLTKYIGFTNAEYNQVGAAVADGDFLSRVSREITVSPSVIPGTNEKVETCIFRGASVEELILRINANPTKEATFTTYKNGRAVGPNLHPGFNTSYTLTDGDKRALRKAVELSECLRTLSDTKGSHTSPR